MKVSHFLEMAWIAYFSGCGICTYAANTTNRPEPVVGIPVPHLEYFCDPANNASTLAQIEDYQKQLKALPSSNKNDRFDIEDKLRKSNSKLQCTYRPI